MSEGEGQSLETQGEEASKDANVTIDEPTAPALDLSPDPNTEWEKAGAEAASTEDDGGDTKSSDDENSDGGSETSDEGDSDEPSEPEGDGSTTEDTSDDTDDDSGQS